MNRTPGTRTNGEQFSIYEVQAVWEKAAPIIGENPALIRQDPCGATIVRFLWGDNTPMGGGWEIDHIVPVSMRGTDDISNLQPLQWQNNRAKNDGIELNCIVPVKGSITDSGLEKNKDF